MCCQRSSRASARERSWHWSTCEGRTSAFQHEELPPEDHLAGDEHMCVLAAAMWLVWRDAAQNWEEELASTLGDPKLTRGVACPCVWSGHIKGEHTVATAHGDERSRSR